MMAAWKFAPASPGHVITNINGRTLRAGDVVLIAGTPHPSLVRAGLVRADIIQPVDAHPSPTDSAQAEQEPRPASADDRDLNAGVGEGAAFASPDDASIRDIAASKGWNRARGRGATDKARAFLAGLNAEG